MKKLMAMLLALVMVLALAACGTKNNEENDTTVADTTVEDTTVAEDTTEAEDTTVGEDTTEAEGETPAEVTGSMTVLNNVWALFAEDQKFPIMGGDAAHVDYEGAGVVDIADLNNLQYMLLVPADQAANIDEAASLMHAMMNNYFTSGAFHVTGDVEAFAEAMYNAVNTNPWVCGFPEKVLIAVVDSEYVVMTFGLGEFLDNFAANLAVAYPEALVLYNEFLEI